MIRTQIYIDEQTHRELLRLAAATKEPMAKIARDMLREGVKKHKDVDTSGIKVLQAIAKMGITGGDDPNLSENIDHYLYGAPKRHE